MKLLEAAQWLEADRLRVGVSPAGSIIALQLDGDDLLAGGAIDEFLGSPFSLRNAWAVSVDGGTITLATSWQSLEMEKRLTIEGTGVRLDYSVWNGGPLFERPAFGLRLSLPPKAAQRWTVPTLAGLRSDTVTLDAGQRYVRPQPDWCAVAAREHLLAMLFPTGTLDAVEVSCGSERFSMTACVYHMGLSPGYEAQFTVLLEYGLQGLDPVAARHEAQAAMFQRSYARAHTKQQQRETDLDGPTQGDDPVAWALRERADLLQKGRDTRLALLRRLGEGRVAVADALAQIGEL